MRVVIRACASQQIGSGHVVRCLALAEALRQHDASVEFICRDHPGNLIAQIKQKGFSVITLPRRSRQDVDNASAGYQRWLGVSQQEDAKDTIQAIAKQPVNWLIADHYALDQDWENLLRPCVDKIMVIDDLANRRHHCEILLDQTYGREDADYHPLVPGSTRLLLGSNNALLRAEFSRARPMAMKRREQYHGIRRVLVSLGSIDELNITPSVLQALALVEWQFTPVVDIVLTSAAPHLSELKKMFEDFPLEVNLHIDIDDMAKRMLQADLAIGAGGTTSWERCSLALPSILIVLAENQMVIGRNLERAGAIISLQVNDTTVANIKNSVEKLAGDEIAYRDMSLSASAICDGAGATRVARELVNG